MKCLPQDTKSMCVRMIAHTKPDNRPFNLPITYEIGEIVEIFKILPCSSRELSKAEGCRKKCPGYIQFTKDSYAKCWGYGEVQDPILPFEVVF